MGDGGGGRGEVREGGEPSTCWNLNIWRPNVTNADLLTRRNESSGVDKNDRKSQKKHKNQKNQKRRKHGGGGEYKYKRSIGWEKFDSSWIRSS